MPACVDGGKSQDDPRQLRVRKRGADADDGHSGDRGGETYLGTVGQGGDHKANVANDRPSEIASARGGQLGGKGSTLMAGWNPNLSSALWNWNDGAAPHIGRP